MRESGGLTPFCNGPVGRVWIAFFGFFLYFDFMGDAFSLAIEIRDLRKVYSGGLEALKGISLTVRAGEFFGLLGPNGAGKSTTIGVLCGLVCKSSGVVSVFGHDLDRDPERVKQCLGVVPQEMNFNIFDPCHYVVVNQAGYYGVPRSVALKRTWKLFDQLGLHDKWNTAAGKLSGGMKRRLMIARALVSEPRVLILDEPTAGVDITLRRSMWSFLTRLNQEGLTIILTTHYLEEAESLCEKIAIIDEGMIIADQPTQTLLEGLHSEPFILYCTPFSMPLPVLADLSIRQVDGTTLEVDLPNDVSITDVIGRLQSAGIQVKRIKNKSNRLEELFIRLVGEAHD